VRAPLSTPELAIWVALGGAELSILALGLLRHSKRELQFFWAYVAALFLREVSWFLIAGSSAYYTNWAFYFFWTSEFALSLMRALAIAEICWRCLRGYPSVWRLTSKLLAGSACLLFIWSVWSALQYANWPTKLFYVGLQHLELMQAVLLVLLLAIAAHYAIRLIPLYRLVLVGMCLYSVVQVSINEISTHSLFTTFHWFDAIRRSSFELAAIIWVYAFARPAPEFADNPELLPQEIYDQFSPHVHEQLRALNERLSEIWLS
jgi:hypothetical protein